MPPKIRQAQALDIEHVSGVLVEAAEWLRSCGMSMWRADELAPERIAADVARGDFFVAGIGAEVAGTVKFQLQDDLFWPDAAPGEAAYMHRLAVRRAYAGGDLSGALLRWAAERARAGRRRFLRLDGESTRLRLRAIYERFGFRHHSNRQVGPYLVARYQLELP